ncbi:MAG: hypothetical protein ABI468_10705, partial [Candidatus Nanopelagicales bacterium]
STATTPAAPGGSGSEVGPGGSIGVKLRAIDHRGDGGGNGLDLSATGPQVNVADQLRRDALIVLLVVTLIGAVTPAAVRARRRRRRRSGRAEGAWDELRDTVRDLGEHWADADTPRQASARLVSRDRLDAEAAAALSRLAADTERARYARVPGALDRRRTEADLRTARRALHARVGLSARLRALLLPPSVLHRTTPNTTPKPA